MSEVENPVEEDAPVTEVEEDVKPAEDAKDEVVSKADYQKMIDKHNELLDKIRKVNAESKSRREMLEAAGIDVKTGKRVGADPVEKAKRALLASELKSSGVTPSVAKLLSGNAPIDTLDFTDDGGLSGTDDIVTKLRETYPDAFEVSKPKPSKVSGLTDRGKPVAKSRTFGELLLGR